MYYQSNSVKEIEMKFLKAGEDKREIVLETEVPLVEVLDLLGEEYIENAVYRTAGGPIGPDDLVSNGDLIIVARAESNG